MKSVIWTSPGLAQALSRQLPGAATEIVTTRQALWRAVETANCLVFVDGERLPEVEALSVSTPIVAILEDSLHTAVGWLSRYPWLSHIVNDSLLQSGMARRHLEAILQNSSGSVNLMRFLGPNVRGRVAKISRASRRTERLDRIGEFMESAGIGARTTLQLRDVAEELLTNAFYDASVAAGYIEGPVSRTSDLTLPRELACEIMYGVRGDDLAFVRVRDSFGSFERARLVEVLRRCARTDMAVQIDDSMGGAGLGLWRVFTAASFVAVSVAPGESTRFLVGVLKHGRAAGGTGPPGGSGRRPQAIHVFFDSSMDSLIEEPLDLDSERSVTFMRR